MFVITGSIFQKTLDNDLVWIGSIPIFKILVKGYSKQEVINELINKLNYPNINIKYLDNNRFYLTDTNLEKFIPFIIKTFRIQNELTLEQVATKMGYKSKTTVSSFENGHIKKMSFVKFLEFINIITDEKLICSLSRRKDEN